ncbi:hypothetical protein OROGR_022053 [Orobanche gracilis]
MHPDSSDRRKHTMATGGFRQLRYSGGNIKQHRIPTAAHIGSKNRRWISTVELIYARPQFVNQQEKTTKAWYANSSKEQLEAALLLRSRTPKENIKTGECLPA